MAIRVAFFFCVAFQLCGCGSQMRARGAHARTTPRAPAAWEAPACWEGRGPP